MSANITPFNSDGGFTTAGNITGGTGNLSALNMSQSVTWPGGSSIYEDSGLVVQGTVGVLITSPGTSQITSGTNTWSFDNAGNLTTPGISGNITGANVISANTFITNSLVGDGNLYLQPDANTAGAYLDIYLTNGPDVHIAGNSENVIIGRDSGANVTVGANGNVTVRADSGTAQNWTFGNDGSLTVAGDILAQEGNDLAVQVFNPTVSGGVTYVVQNRQVDLDNARTTQFEVAPANIVITTDFSGTKNQWTFSANGNLNLPGGHASLGISNSGYLTTLGNDSTSIAVDGDNGVVTLATNGGGTTYTFVDNFNSTTSANVLSLILRNGDSNPVNSKPQITMGYADSGDYAQYIHTIHNAGTPVNNRIEFWTSDGTQAGTFPANAILGLTVTNGNIATGNITSFTTISTPVALSSLTAVAGARAFVNNGNLVAAGNFGAQIGAGGSNTVPVWSDGTNWYIG